MRPDLRWAEPVALALCALSGFGYEAGAQDATALPARTAASVEYLGVDGLYLGVGSDQGAARGDTVTIYAAMEGGGPLGRLVFTSVTRRRAVATALDAPLSLQVGDTVFMPLMPPSSTANAADVASSSPETSARRTLAGRTGGAQVSGRIALDLEARETLTSWSGELFGETRRRFATPTSRLSLSVTELPGGLALRTNLRASYRYDELPGGPPPVSVRAYELAAAKSFDAVPLELVVGRFSNPYERYSAYWDGALARVGGASGLGAGVVAGFEPELHNEGVSSALPKMTAFTDFAARGSGWRYDTDASFHWARPAGAPERRFVGWSQRATIGPLALDQRLRADNGASATQWSLTHLRLRGAVRLRGALRLRSTYSRSASVLPTSLPWADSLTSPVRREVTLGFDLSGGLGYLSVEAGRTTRDGDAAGLSLYGNAVVRMHAVQLLRSGRRWSRDSSESWSAAPAASLQFSVWDLRAGYRLYRTSDGSRDLTSHSAEGRIGITLAHGTSVALMSERQWGPSLSGTRLALSLWRSF
jgi:hypothetical protein